MAHVNAPDQRGWIARIAVHRQHALEDKLYELIFEGIIHVGGIMFMQQPKPYTPGMVTALAEFVLGASCLAYLIASCPVAWWEYLVAAVLYFACFAFMQSRLTKLVGMRYRELPKLMRARVKEQRGR